MFKFPKYYLRDSLIFRRIFESLLGNVEDAEHVKVSGDGTPQNPFSCTKIDRKALESFLALHRTTCVNRNTCSTMPYCLIAFRIYDPEAGIVGKDHWLNVLKVSYFWKMEKLGKFAVGQLSKIPLEGVEKLKLAKRYDIRDKEWKLSAIRELIKMDTIFPDIDVQEIGVDIVQRICTLRGIHSQRLFAVSDGGIKKVFPELASPVPKTS